MTQTHDQEQQFRTHWEQTAQKYGTEKWNPTPDFLYSIEIPIDKDCVSTMETISESIKQNHNTKNGLWVPPQRMQITLALPARMGFHFQQNEIRIMKKELIEILKKFSPFSVILGHLNCFPNSLFREVYDDSGTLFQLHKDICERIPFSQNPAYQFENYLPHMSLYYGKGDPKLFQSPSFSRELEPNLMPVNRIFLAKTKNKEGEYEKQIIEEFILS